MPTLARNLVFIALLILVVGGAFALGYQRGQQTEIAKETPRSGGTTSPFSSPDSLFPKAAVTTAQGLGIPPNSSQEMREFLANRATLSRKMVDLRKANPTGADDPPPLCPVPKRQRRTFAAATGVIAGSGPAAGAASTWDHAGDDHSLHRLT